MQELKPSAMETGPGIFLFRLFFVFVPVFIFSFSFPHALLPDAGKFFSPFFEIFAGWTAEHVFGSNSLYAYKLVSDSSGMYANALNIFVFALLVAGAWTFLRKKTQQQNLKTFFFVFIRYYLASQLLCYAFSKIFKYQFYLPEPNTLFTTVGNTPRDMLYWTSMGSSYTYTVFSGIIELIPALLLLFRRTTLLGALIAAGVMINVLMINIGFDISVKLYSAFLLLLCILLVAPHRKRLLQFFSGKATNENRPQPFYRDEKWKRVYVPLKIAVIALLLLDSCFYNLQTGNFNDDKFPRPPLHGAYEINFFRQNGETLLHDPLRWKRVFIHRRNYLIVQHEDETMQDFPIETDTAAHLIRISAADYFSYRVNADSSLSFTGKIGADDYKLELRKIPLENLPLLKKEFGWMMDQ